MKKNRHRLLLIMLLCMVMAVSTGAKLYAVQLKNDDPKLVDISKIITGNSAVTYVSDEDTEGEEQAEDTDDSDSSGDTDDKKEAEDTGTKAEETKQVNNDINIKVRGTRIYINNVQIRDADTLETRISEKLKAGSTVTVTDWYADYTTYMEVKDCLEKMGITPEESRIS